MWMNTPSGVVKNTLHTGSGIGSPDLLRLMNQSYADIVLPLTSGGEPPNGSYSFRTQSRVWGTPSLNTIANASSAGFFEVAGNIEAAVTALLGGYFIVDSGLNKGVYTVTSAVYDGTANTIVNVEESVLNDLVGVGDFIYFDTYTDYLSVVSTHVYDFERPVGGLSATYSCKVAEMTIIDTTNYAAKNAGAGIMPFTNTKNISAIAPVNPDGTGFTPTTTNAAADSLQITSLWTGTWQLGLNTTTAYCLDLWFTVLLGVSTKKDVLVQCDDCACVYFTCIKQLWERYYSAVTFNTTRAATIRGILVEMEHAWMLYQMAAQCGYDTSLFCAKIKELAAADDCICSSSDDGLSTAIVPWGAGSGGGAGTPGSVWHNGSGTPASALGATGDYYLNDDTGDYYKKSGSGWVLQGNLKGSATQWLNGSANPLAADGSIGDFYLNNATKEYFEKTGVSTWTSLGYLTSMIKLYEDISDSALAGNTSLQYLKGSPLPAGLMSASGDELIVETQLELAANLGGAIMEINVFLGGITIAAWTGASPGNPTKMNILSRFSFTGVGAASGHYVMTDTSAVPAESIYEPLYPIAVDFTIANDIRVGAQSNGGGVGDVICKYLRIYVLKK